MATHSIILAWRIPWTEEPGRLQSMVSQRVGHDWATNTSPHVPGIIRHWGCNSEKNHLVPCPPEADGFMGEIGIELIITQINIEAKWQYIQCQWAHGTIRAYSGSFDSARKGIWKKSQNGTQVWMGKKRKKLLPFDLIMSWVKSRTVKGTGAAPGVWTVFRV